MQTGLDEVFSHEKDAIILEDDTLPDLSFFSFCEELLSKYEQDERIAHISGCNLHPEASQGNSSYSTCSFVNIWGWATWARAWKHFDLQMSGWSKEHKTDFLRKWCQSKKEIQETRKIFDLHCDNIDPWTWDYQWIYACWSQNGLSAFPHINLVRNIGIGPNASNTKNYKEIPYFPERVESIDYPLTHPPVNRDKNFERRYHKAQDLPITRKLKNFLKTLCAVLRKRLIGTELS